MKARFLPTDCDQSRLKSGSKLPQGACGAGCKKYAAFQTKTIGNIGDANSSVLKQPYGCALALPAGCRLSGPGAELLQWPACKSEFRDIISRGWLKTRDGRVRDPEGFLNLESGI
jgi:hypothetical protein